jgi:hypothetical protein
MAENIKLHLGFINTPYTTETIARPMTAAKAESRRKRKRSFSKTMTAEDVSNILEEKYHILDTFYQVHRPDVEMAVLTAFTEVARDIVSGQKKYRSASLPSLLKDATAEIEKSFRRFLDTEEMNGRQPGVPTAAALSGVRHGRGRKTLTGPRPSFIDTGIYRASFRARADVK